MLGYRVSEMYQIGAELKQKAGCFQGNFLQDLLIDEGVAAIDALSRATLLQLLRNLGPLALPLTLPLNFLLGGGNPQQILSREVVKGFHGFSP